MSDDNVEAMIALEELNMLGLIEFKTDDLFGVTDKGVEEARNIIEKLPLKERILIMVAMPELVPDTLERATGEESEP